MEMAVKLGKRKTELHCGICGEHGGDPSSVEFCHKIGLTMFPARRSVYRLHDLLLHRLLLTKVGRSSLSFELPLGFEQAAAYRKANGQYVRKNQWRDTTVRVFIDLD